jgi:urea transporter
MKYFIDSILYSYSQIFFCNRRWFGVTALAATFLAPKIGAMALCGVVISNLTAHVLRFDKEKIKSGFYGFNGILFGAATTFYFELDLFLIFIALIFMVITFIVAAVLENYLATAFNLPGLSLPFIITLYIFVIFLTNYNHIVPALTTASDLKFYEYLPQSIKYYFQSFALILFQPNITSGILIALGILFFSRVLFLLSVAAFALNYFFLHFILPDQAETLIIISGFNSILTAFALGGSLIIPSRKSFVLVIISILMVVIITGFFYRILLTWYLPILVLPFNFVVLFTIYSLKFRSEYTDLVLLYFKPGSPEENYYYHHMRTSRFERFKHTFAELPFFGEWFVSQGFDGKYTHKEEWKYAWDFVVTDRDLKEYSNEGTSLTDYYCFRLPVAAPIEGEVVKVIDGIPSNKVGEVNISQNWGNTVILKHNEELYSTLSHLEANSIKVKEGNKIKRGEIIGACGNSGRSPYPHLHFQFQLTDKLGDKTYKFPFAQFLKKENNRYHLKTFNYPEENDIVQNVEIHKTVKEFFNFKLGSELKFQFEQDGEVRTENWEVKINLNNEFYIESSSGDIAYFYISDKIFYFTSYNGKKNSALYYFYLIAHQVPMCYHQNLYWEDDYSIAQLPAGVIRYLSEIFLMYKSLINAKGSLNFEEKSDHSNDIIFSNSIEIKGGFPFSFYRKNFSGKVILNDESKISEFNFSRNGKVIFRAKQL